MIRETKLSKFGGGEVIEVEGPESPDTCTGVGCDEDLAGVTGSLCFDCEDHKHWGDGELVDREEGYSPNQPECGYCGKEARGDHPRRCLSCGLLDASEVIGA
jgi:hypothetical protein